MCNVFSNAALQIALSDGHYGRLNGAPDYIPHSPQLRALVELIESAECKGWAFVLEGTTKRIFITEEEYKSCFSDEQWKNLMKNDGWYKDGFLVPRVERPKIEWFPCTQHV